MKKLISLIASAVIFAGLLPLMGINAFAAVNDYNGWDGNWQNSCLIDIEFNDGKGLFDDTNFAILDEKVKECAKELEMNIIIYIGGSYRSDASTMTFCNQAYENTFGEDTDGVFYYIDLSGKSPAYDYISTSGKVILLLEDHKEDIFSHLDNYLPASGNPVYESDIYNAVASFLNQLELYSEKEVSYFSYYHDTNTNRYIYYKDGELMITPSKPPALWLHIALICTGIGILIAFISYFAIKHAYKFKSKTNPSVYLSGNNVQFSEKSDTFIRSYTTKHKIESSSGGHHGGGHHGGGSHGGGGHHR